MENNWMEARQQGVEPGTRQNTALIQTGHGQSNTMETGQNLTSIRSGPGQSSGEGSRENLSLIGSDPVQSKRDCQSIVMYAREFLPGPRADSYRSELMRELSLGPFSNYSVSDLARGSPPYSSAAHVFLPYRFHLRNRPSLPPFPADRFAGLHYIMSRSPGAPDVHALRIFSVINNYFWYDVPPIPFRGGLRSGCQCASASGKIYVVGGVEDGDLASTDVFAYGLTTNQWTRCSQMLYPRMNFGIGVMHGKIYAFGGMNLREPVLECEMYDPQVNAWSRIPNMLESRVNPQVSVVRDMFLIFGGRVHVRDSYVNGDLVGDSDDVIPCKIMVYYPQTYIWTWTPTEREQHWIDSMFMAKGNLFRLTDSGLTMCPGDPDLQNSHSWRQLHRFPDEVTSFYKLSKLGCRTTILGDELWIVARHPKTGLASCLLRTRGLGSVNQLIWIDLTAWFYGRFDEGSTMVFPLEL